MSRARDVASMASGLKAGGGYPAGHIVQTKFVAFDEQQIIGDGSSTGKTFVTIGSGVSGKEFSLDMAVSSGNIILGFGTVNLNANGRYSTLKVFSDSDQIALGQSNGSMARVTVSGQIAEDSTALDQYVMFNSSFSFSYTPSDTNSHTYTIKAGNVYDNARLTYINKPHRTNDTGTYMQSGYSHFTIMEIEQ